MMIVIFSFKKIVNYAKFFHIADLIFLNFKTILRRKVCLKTKLKLLNQLSISIRTIIVHSFDFEMSFGLHF